MEGKPPVMIGSISFSGALTILFIGLKLCKVIDWSWWWVLSPLWIPTVAFVALAAFLCLAMLLIVLVHSVAEFLVTRRS